MLKQYEYVRYSASLNDQGEFVILYKGNELDYNKYSETLLNKLGDEGWELINIVPITSTTFENQAMIPVRADTVASYVYTSSLVMHFKREVTDTSDLKEEWLYKELLDIDDKYYKYINRELNQEEDILSKYLEMGYVNTFKHKARLEFEKDMVKVRFNKVNDVWIIEETGANLTV